MAGKTKKDTVEEIVEEATEVKEKNSKNKRITEARKKVKNLKRVDRDVEVIVMKNVYGGWSYMDKATGSMYRIDSEATTEVIPMGVLMKMNSSHSKILGRFQIVPIDVYSDEFTVEDVIENLNLTKKYKEEVNPSEIEDFILSNENISTFSESIGKLSRAMKTRVVERAIALFKEGEFNDPTKKGILMKIADNNMIFEQE